MLFDISEAGEIDNEIYTNKLIQKLLTYKFLLVKPMAHFLTALHASFLFCILALPVMEKDDHDKFMVGTYLILFLLREFIQILAVLI